MTDRNDETLSLAARRTAVGYVVFPVSLLGLYAISLNNYILFHTVAELYMVGVSSAVFLFTWNLRYIMDNSYLLFIGISFLFAAVLDISHILAYAGVALSRAYENNLNTTAQLWISSRYLLCVSFFIAPLLRRMRLAAHSFITMLIYCCGTLLALLCIYVWKIFPIVIVDSHTPMAFYRVSEYVSSILFCLSAVHLFVIRSEFDPVLVRYLIAAVALLFVRGYMPDVSSENERFGHLLEIISFYCVYKAVIHTGLNRPYELLFRNLKREESRLSQAVRANALMAKLTRSLLHPMTYENISHVVLQYAKRLTGSASGWVGYIDPSTGYLVSPTLTPAQGAANHVPTKGVIFKEFTGLWGWVLNTRSPIMTNSPSEDLRSAGIPPGPIPIERFLSAPAVIKDTLVGQIALANPPRNYTKTDLVIVERLAALYAIAIDNKRSEEELLKAEQLKIRYRSQLEWQNTFDSITDLVSIHDTGCYIINANRAFLRYHGLELKEAIGRTCGEVVFGGRCPTSACPLDKTLSAREPIKGEIIDPATHKLFRDMTYPYHTPDGDCIGVIHVMQDITEEREREQKIILNEKLAALGTIASNISHEINNPLTSIDICATSLLRRLSAEEAPSGTFAEYLKIISDEVSRCKEITTRVLSFVQDRLHGKEVVSISEPLESILTILSLQGRLRNITVVKKYLHSSDALLHNAGELRQALLAIILNALDSMEDRGTLTLETEDRNDVMVIHIGDTGPGIPQEHVEKIFLPFFTTKSDKGGTGLGLSVAKGIIDKFHGKVTFTSDPGTGTRFTVSLPLLPETHKR